MLYGRAREQAAVDAMLAGAREGRSAVLVLRGEPGIGKSALLDHAAERAGEEHRLIRVTGVESEADLPFAGLHLLLAPALDRLPALPAPQRRALENAFGLADVGPADRLLTGLATLALLAELAADRPLVCLVDDAQWLDRASAEALLLAARRLDREGVVLLFAARDGEGAFAAPGLPELRLAGLDPTAAAALLTSREDGRATERVRFRVLAQAQGNPLALTELPVEFAAVPGSAADSAFLDGGLPLTGRLQLALHGQVTRLPAGARTLLLLAAAEETGDPAVVRGAAQQLGVRAEDFAAVEAAGLLRFSLQGRYVLRTSLLRTVLLQQAAPDSRTAVHRTLGRLLREAGQEDRGSWHLSLAVSGQDAELAEALERVAARAGARGGHAGASAAYERAARLNPDRTAAARCLLLAAEAALDAAESDRAEALAVRAGEWAEEPYARAVLAWVRATAHFWRGSYPDAYRLLLTAAESEITPPDAARLLLQAFHAAWYLGAAQTEVVLDRLAALSLPAGDPTEPLVRHLLATALPALGRSGPVLPTAAETVRRARAAGAEGPRELLPICGATLILGRDAETYQLATELIAEARLSGSVGPLPTLLFFLAEAELFHGRHRDAEVSLAEGLALARDTGQPQWLSQLCALDAYVAALRGDGARVTERVTERVAEALADAASAWGAPAAGSGWAQWALAVHDLGQGRAAGAADRLAALTGGPLGHHVSAVRAVPDLVEAAVRLGEPERAAEAFERYRRWATAAPGWARALVARCQALLGPDELAESGYLAALKLHAADDRPFELARTSLLFGEWLRRPGRSAGRADAAGGAHRQAGRAGALQPGHRGAALPQPADRGAPPVQGVPEARGRLPG